MLVVERAEREGLWVGDILVKFLGNTEDGLGRIGIQAPREIPITRTEDSNKDDNVGKRYNDSTD